MTLFLWCFTATPLYWNATKNYMGIYIMINTTENTEDCKVFHEHCFPFGLEKSWRVIVEIWKIQKSIKKDVNNQQLLHFDLTHHSLSFICIYCNSFLTCSPALISTQPSSRRNPAKMLISSCHSSAQNLQCFPHHLE